MIHPDPLVSLYTIDVPSDPPTKLRLTAHPAIDDTSGVALYFERDSTGAALPYYSCQVWHEETRADSEGGLQKIELVVQNVSREMIALAETYSGLTGSTVRHVTVRRSELPDAAERYEEFFDVLDSNFTETEARFTCGRAALASAKFPGRRISRTHCQHRYGGPGCGYDTTRAGALQTCDFTLEDCTAHGLDEEAASLENRHPRRILLFPGVVRGTNAV